MPSLKAWLEHRLRTTSQRCAHLHALQSLCSSHKIGYTTLLGSAEVVCAGTYKLVEEWTAVGRSYKGKGKGPSGNCRVQEGQEPHDLILQNLWSFWMPSSFTCATVMILWCSWGEGRNDWVLSPIFMKPLTRYKLIINSTHWTLALTNTDWLKAPPQ